MKKLDELIAKIVKQQQNTLNDFGVAIAVGALVIAGIAFGVEYIF